MAPKEERHEVIIIGGGIAGMTLALMCDKLGIDYIVLEARDHLEAGKGAGVALQPNGLCILDQLGIADELETANPPLSAWYSYDADGNLLNLNHVQTSYRERVGYPILCTERRRFRQLLLEHVSQKEKHIKAPCRVASIVEDCDDITVTTEDGSRYTGEVLIGADGVRSHVRSFIDQSQPAPQSSDQYMSARLVCCYGTSSLPPGVVTAGHRFSVYRETKSIIGFTSNSDTLFWFVFEALAQPLPLSRTPRYTDAQAQAFCQPVLHVTVLPGLTFGQLYANRTFSLLTPLDEGIAPAWHTDRAVLVGDAAHKMTPASGMGANLAIESSAAVINELMRAKETATTDRSRGVPRQALRAAWQRYVESREERIMAAFQLNDIITRALLLQPGLPARVASQTKALTDEALFELAVSAWSNAPVLRDMKLTRRGRAMRAAMFGETEKAQAAWDVRGKL